MEDILDVTERVIFVALSRPRVGVRGLEQGQHARVRREAWDASPIGPRVLPAQPAGFSARDLIVSNSSQRKKSSARFFFAVARSATS